MYYENDRGRVYYELHGEENNAPVLVFSHGICMDHKTFFPQADALKDRYRVLIWDMPSHGLSSSMDYKSSFTDTAADFIVELLDHTGTDKAILVGQSLGSFVTQKVAYRHPERVEATVHIGGWSLYPGYTPLLQLFNPLIALFISLYPKKSVFKTFASHRALKPETRAYMEQTAARTGKKVMSHITRELLRDMIKGLPEPAKEPMLLLHGDHEAPFVKNNMQKMHENNPNSQLTVIKDAHHIANQDNPEELNRILLAFLEELQASGQ
ncbi:alpha/beta fold hydrolase [Dethiobacter alkaliphilus]|uniref:Alpha/beta hydrolase fold protein n=1 Tax=Dethiobacter alkaliphilus AHT 1 TaxID=555088 RepID=C0GCD1_DETAL|nr:alpha/beta hydrolase [Dethiobacter alkaliphilus]EEG78866.1 alpha/beta hydrolase fold protein [Dethiobacter alkaliphilus AHT 1]